MDPSSPMHPANPLSPLNPLGINYMFKDTGSSTEVVTAAPCDSECRMTNQDMQAVGIVFGLVFAVAMIALVAWAMGLIGESHER